MDNKTFLLKTEIMQLYNKYEAKSIINSLMDLNLSADIKLVNDYVTITNIREI